MRDDWCLLLCMTVAMCPEDGKVERQCFDETQDFVFKLMEQRFVHGYTFTVGCCTFL